MNGSGNKAARLQNLAVLPICVHAWCKQPWEWYQGLFVPPHWQDNIKANIRQAGLIGLPLWWLRHSNFHICCLKWGCKNCHVFFDKFNSGPTKSLKSWQSTCAEHVLQAIACMCWPLCPPPFFGGGVDFYVFHQRCKFSGNCWKSGIFERSKTHLYKP